MQTVIVTGVTGFLGSRLARQLLARGDAVIGIKRKESPRHHIDYCGIGSQIEFHDADAEDFDLTQIIGTRQVAALFHTAALSRSGENAADLAAMIDTNIKTPLLWISAAKKAGVKVVVNASTSWQSVDGQSYSPFNIYAATKEASENVLTSLVAPDFTCVSLRLFDTYGAGDRRRKIVDLLIDAIRSGKELAMSPGEQSINLLHIKDVAAAFIGAADLASSGHVTGHRVYSLSAVDSIGLRALAEKISGWAQQPVNIIWGGRPYRSNEVMFPHASHPPLPSWQPVISLERGIKEMLGASPAPTR
jgi:nucleoside-diphosphate-sugar epimerase